MKKHISLPRSRMWRTRAATALAAAGALVMSGGLVMLAAPAATATGNTEPCTPKAAWTETTDWVTQSPGEGWYQVDERTIPGTDEVLEYKWKMQVVDQQGTDTVFGYLWHVYNGNSETPPALNDSHWHAPPGQPPAPNMPAGVQAGTVYSTSTETGSGSWFYYEQVVVTPGTPTTYKWIYKWSVDSPGEGWIKTDESRVKTPGSPAVTEYKFAFDHPAVTCEDEGEDVKVLYCHWDNGNEYENHSNGSAAGLISGHMDHEKDIWPAFDYKGEHYAAQGDQTILTNGCVVPPSPTDLCSNIDGVQTTVPAGMVRNNDGTCSTPPPPPTDVCPNIPGLQASVPAGYQVIDGDCVQILGVEEIAPTVSFTDPTCEHLNRAKWSGNLTDLVDYTVSGTPGRGNSITVTANIKPAVADEFAFPAGFDNTFDHSYPSKADLNCATVKGSESSRPKPHKSPTVLGTQAVAPTAVDAGLATLPGDSATSTASLLAQLMVAGGLLLLLAGGWLGLGRREYGSHEA